jgi:hypothetical protein
MAVATAIDSAGVVYTTVLSDINTIAVFAIDNRGDLVGTYSFRESATGAILSDPKVAVDTSDNIYISANRTIGSITDVVVAKINGWSQYISGVS